jgi:hypothetical protein
MNSTDGATGNGADVFAAHMEAVAQRLLGEPNKDLSSKTEWRYGTNGSLSVDLEKGTWFDHEVGKGGGCLDLIIREGKAADRGAAARWLRDELGIDIGIKDRRKSGGKKPLGRLIASYPYRDASGKVVFEVRRYPDHQFRQCRPNLNAASGWTFGLKGVPRPFPLFMLPELVAADMFATIYICEGEKDALNLLALGFVATTNSCGAKGWELAGLKPLRGRRVAVLPDNDDACSPWTRPGQAVQAGLPG